VEIKDLFGLPAHPLVVHAAVVLLPLAAIAAIVAAAIPRLRPYYAPVALVLALGATASVGLAQQTGESLQERVPETRLVEDHVEMGQTVLPWAVAVTVAAAAATAAPFAMRKREVSARTVTGVLLAASIIVGAGAIYSVAEVGHSGAKATWSKVDAGGGG